MTAVYSIILIYIYIYKKNINFELFPHNTKLTLNQDHVIINENNNVATLEEALDTLLPFQWLKLDEQGALRNTSH